MLLLGIEDDSSLHSFLHYPKDLVEWAKANTELQDSGDTTALRRGAIRISTSARITP